MKQKNNIEEDIIGQTDAMEMEADIGQTDVMKQTDTEKQADHKAREKEDE